MQATYTIAELKDRLSRDVNDVEAAVSLGNYYYDIGDAGLAISYYLRALDINSDMPGVRTDLGTMYWRNNDIGLSEVSFRKAIASDPGFVHAYMNLGLLLQREKFDEEGARALWQQIVEIAPDNEVADKARGLLAELPAPTASSSSFTRMV
ncbi:MAG: tetratricopeptide repeat protein [Nitrosomonadales bacterium]|nr:tetratricopeptide repeat protein [Nitrosomonadales bacterium]